MSEIIEKLRNEEFNTTSEERLKSHAYLHKAERGELTLAERRAFACEQHAILHSDALSFRHLAEKSDEDNATFELFHKIYEGELEAIKLLVQHATSLGLTESDLSSYEPKAQAQGYPSFLARLALKGQTAGMAAACAVNFPAWGRMCARLASAYRTHHAEVDLKFLDFFASPLEGLDGMAAGVIERGGDEYQNLARAVRLLQEYELMFWDAMLH